MLDIDYESDLRIDPDALDVECLEQSQKFMRYSKLAVDAAADLDRAKEKLDITRAERDTDIRHKALNNSEKITEAVVAGRIIQDPAYKIANDFYLVKKHEYDILTATVRAFQQRKDMLENLIRLAGQGYFATPAVPRNLSAEAKKHMEDSTIVHNEKRAIFIREQVHGKLNK